MTDILRQLPEPRLGQQAGVEKSKTAVERDILDTFNFLKRTFKPYKTNFELSLVSNF